MKRRVIKEEKECIIKKISTKLNELMYIKFAYIFGSFMKEKEFSDIDIGIYIEEKEINDYLDIELDLEEELQSIINLPVDVRIINHAPLSFVYHVIKEGVLILERDTLKRSDFESLIFKKYFDFSHFRREYLKEVVNAPI